MGWFVTYLIACAVNTILIREYTDLGLSDAAMWLWMIIPGIAYGCAAEIYRKG